MFIFVLIAGYSFDTAFPGCVDLWTCWIQVKKIS